MCSDLARATRQRERESRKAHAAHLHFFVYINKIHFPAGLLQGILTGIRGLSNGFGPATFGLLFYIFHVQLDEATEGEGIDNPYTGVCALCSSSKYQMGGVPGCHDPGVIEN